MVTLRGEKMYEFLDRLINIALPRVRDFRGVPTKSFDGRGNYTLGIRDHLIFPEIDITKVDKSKGMNITIVTKAKNDDQARFLLRELGMPFSEVREEHMAKISMIVKAERKPKFMSRKVNRCKAVRTSARVSAEVSALPHLLPAAFARRLHPGHHEGELVAPAHD